MAWLQNSEAIGVAKSWSRNSNRPSFEKRKTVWSKDILVYMHLQHENVNIEKITKTKTDYYGDDFVIDI